MSTSPLVAEISQTSGRPAHVPDGLVMDFDCYNVTIPDQDVGAFWLDLKDKAPGKVFWTDHNGGHWVLLDGHDVQRAYSDFTTFSNQDIFIPPNGSRENLLIPLELDPPESLRYRKIVVSPLMPAKLGEVFDEAREMTIRIIEELKPTGECEFVKDFGTALPILVFLSMMGLPASDREMLLPLAEMSTRPETPEQRVFGHSELKRYLRGHVERCRKSPGPDMLSKVVNSSIDGELMDLDAALRFSLTLLIGGLDTVANLLSFVALFLARNPDHRRQILDNPEIVSAAADEFIRRFGVVADGRRVLKDTMMSGVLVKAGDMLMAPTWMYGLDDTIVTDPLTVDFRRPKFPHVTFGGGPHVCVGMHLAKRELRIFIEEWIARIPDFEVKPGAELHVETGIVQGLSTLPLVWK